MSSLQDAGLGKNLFLYSSHVTASEFVNTATDDVLLIDYVEDDVTKKSWHCSNLRQADMLAQSVTSIYNEIIGDNDWYTSVPDWMKYLQKCTLTKAKDVHQLQFLGLVSLYQTKTGSRVCAFHIHSFVLYRFLEQGSQTKVDLLLCQSELIHLSARLFRKDCFKFYNWYSPT